jgi:hypothetical protein
MCEVNQKKLLFLKLSDPWFILENHFRASVKNHSSVKELFDRASPDCVSSAKMALIFVVTIFSVTSEI